MAWTFERTVAVVNVVALVVGGAFAGMDWLPKHRIAEIEANEAALQPTDTSDVMSAVRIKAYRDGSVLYDVGFSIDSTNKGRSDIDFSYSKIMLFLGSETLDRTARDQAEQVNNVPDLWYKSEYNAPIRWRQVACSSDVETRTYSAQIAQFLRRDCPAEPGIDDGLTGRFPPGTDNGYSPHFLVHAQPGQYVGVSFSWGINGATDPASPDVGIVKDMQRLL